MEKDGFILYRGKKNKRKTKSNPTLATEKSESSCSSPIPREYNHDKMPRPIPCSSRVHDSDHEVDAVIIHRFLKEARQDFNLIEFYETELKDIISSIIQKKTCQFYVENVILDANKTILLNPDDDSVPHQELSQMCKENTRQKDQTSKEEKNFNEHPWKLMCLGLGNFSCSVIARWQLVLLKILQEDLKINRSKCEVFDPVFNQEEKKILESLGMSILNENKVGEYCVNSPTIFYMPHCSKGLYNNLLRANWSTSQLCNLVIIGNSFESMSESLPSRIMEEKLNCVFKMLPYVEEHSIGNTFKFNDIFNDTSIMTFNKDRLESISDSFWEDLPKPTVWEDDNEIIK